MKRYDVSPTAAQAFSHAVEQRLHGFEDPNCQITANPPITEAIKLFSDDPLEGRKVPEAELAIVEADPETDIVLNSGAILRFQTAHNVYIYHTMGGRLLRRSAPKEHERELWQRSNIDHHADDFEAGAVVNYINGLKERPLPLYRLDGEDAALWTLRCRLPVPLPREVVLNELHDATQSIRYDPRVPIDDIASKGLSGALIGRNDAEWVDEVIFARDPSKRYGTRISYDNDYYAYRIAAVNGWQEVTFGPDEEDMPKGFVRSIMGRNANLYSSGDGAFTIEEARAMLPVDSPLALTEGYLWADRPGWEKPYGEPAAIVEATRRNSEELAAITRAMGELAWRLNRQDRWVQEIADLPGSTEQERTIAFKRNVRG